MLNHLCNSLRVSSQVAFPYSQNGVTTGSHVAILRLIESHALAATLLERVEEVAHA